VCIHKKTGAIYSAYCTCFAGYAYMYNTNWAWVPCLYFYIYF
jgi:hypothetical protein